MLALRVLNFGYCCCTYKRQERVGCIYNFVIILLWWDSRVGARSQNVKIYFLTHTRPLGGINILYNIICTVTYCWFHSAYSYLHVHTQIHYFLFHQQLHGSVGLLFTNKSKEEVQEWFKTFSDQDFARSGFISDREISLDAGPLKQFSHNMEPQLRKLGLPTALKKGTW